MEPRDYQRIALRALESARKRGETSALVVMASSLGKTIVAALDVMRFLTECNGKCVLGSDRDRGDSNGNNCSDDGIQGNSKSAIHDCDVISTDDGNQVYNDKYRSGAARILCLCHSNGILGQNLDKFKQILGKQYSYGLFNGYEKNYTVDIVFASFQSILIHQDLFQEDDFDYIVVDEAHHAPARTYRRAIEFFKPRFLLGVTATPDRMDGKKLEDIFGPIIYDLDLVEAMKLGLLVKVDYHVLLDELVNLDSIIATGEKISAAELNRRLFVPKRDEEIIRLIESKVEVYNGNSVIIFCRSIEHAERINALLPDSRLVHSSMDEEVWQQNLADFKDGRAKYIVSVDQLNEGIDIPRADILVFLRSTVSQIVYYQQLGRGLRTHEGKDRVVVLDFVASYERLKTIATLQRDTQSTDDEEAKDYFDLNIEATQFKERKVDIFSVLETIKRLTRTYTKEELISQVQMLARELGRTPTSVEFEDDSRTVSAMTAIKLFGSWNEFLKVAGLEVNTKTDYTKEELIRQVLMLAEELGRTPTTNEFKQDSRTASVSTVIKLFGSWNEFLEAAGLGVNRKPIRTYTKEELISQVQMLARELDRTPTHKEFSDDSRMASVSIVKRLFGSWNEFLEAAGLKANRVCKS